MPQLVWVIPLMMVAVYVATSIKILSEYERGVVFRLGRVLTAPRGPGIALVFAVVERMVRMSLRVETMEVPTQDVSTRDNIRVKVSAIVYFRVIDPIKAVTEVKNVLYASSQLAGSGVRSVVGEVDLDSLLSQRDRVNERLQTVLDQHTEPWGVKLSMAEVKQVDLPGQMMRIIACPAEDLIQTQPSTAIQLRIWFQGE